MRSITKTDRSRRSRLAPFAIIGWLRRASAIGLVAALSIFAFGLAAAVPSRAAECNADIGALMKKRQDIIEHLQNLAKSSPKGQLDPAVSCPVLRTLAVAEHDLSAYLTKNKDWCMVPDNAIQNIDSSAKRTQTIAGKACQVAEQIKKGQEAIINSAPKLPTGPL